MDTKETASDRRRFLKLAGAGVVGGTAAAVSVATGGAPAQAETAADPDALYRETEHIKRYYQLAKDF